jgi:hypothetical protein
MGILTLPSPIDVSLARPGNSLSLPHGVCFMSPILAGPTRIFLIALLLAGVASGCITVGREFPQDAVAYIKVGQTTLDEIRATFGIPVRTGIEEGKVAWTYARYHANVLGDFDGKDLIIRFDDQNKVTGISFSSTDVARKLK